MSGDDWLAIVVIASCTILNFFFSLAETALASLRTTRLQHVVRGGDSNEDDSATVRVLLGEPLRVAAAVQTGLTFLSLTAVAVAVVVLSHDATAMLKHLRVPNASTLSVVLLVCIVALLTLVVGEIVPRSVALSYPQQVAVLVSRPLHWLGVLSHPIVVIVLALSNLIVKPFGISASFSNPVLTEEELRHLLDSSERQGVIQEDEKEMLHNVISFGDTPVHSVMTPRIDVKAVEVGESVENLIRLIVECGHSRIPVYENTIDSVIGIVHAKDLLPREGSHGMQASLMDFVRTPIYVPEHMRTGTLLEQLRRTGSQLAIVQDEYSGTAGLVTIEDLMEELVGEIQDEYDVEEPMVVMQSDGSAIVDARINIDDVNKELGLDLPDEEFDTLGGLVFGLFGHAPAEGERIVHDDVTYEVARAEGHRLQKIRVIVGR